MKRISKMLSVVLVMVMLISALPMTSASALNLFPDLELDVPMDVHYDGSRAIYSFVPEEDGIYQFYGLGECDAKATLYNFMFQKIEFGDNSYQEGETNFNFIITATLKGSKKYYLKVEADMFDISDYVDIQIGVRKALEVESIEITQEPYNNTVIKGYEGETMDPSGLEAVFTMSDGSKVNWSFDLKDYVCGYTVEEEIFIAVDAECYLKLSCGEASVIYYFTIVENPIERIEYNCDTPIKLYFETYGSYDDDYGAFIYDYELPQDATLIFYYKDGTSEEKSVHDEEVRQYISTMHNQIVEPWGIGEHYIELTYLGLEDTVPVIVLPRPTITLNSAPTREYVFGSMDGSMEDGKYRFSASDLTGLSITVEFADGTQVTYDDSDIDMEYSMLDGYAFELSENEVEGPGVVTAYFEYLGVRVEYPVKVIDESELKVGDVDGDGKISVMDVTNVQYYIAQDKVLDSGAIVRADTDFNGEVTISDATRIQRYLAGYITEF